MLLWDKKRALETILSRRNSKGEVLSGPAPMKAENVKTEEGEADGRHMAAQDAMAAIHEKSPIKFMDALANFLDIHSGAAPKE